ncbi:MAG: amino acid--tRNA ligase-related protein [Spirochaetota bacterium]
MEKAEVVMRRAKLYQEIRRFFSLKDYSEVETPILADVLLPEPTIDHFATLFNSDFHPGREYYLIPSPEIHMKQLLAEGIGNMYQITKCFRNSEQIGRLHNPEFSMLEWYTQEANYLDSIAFTEELIQKTSGAQTPEHVTRPFRTMTVAEACWNYAGFDLERSQSLSSIRKAADRLGHLHVEASDSWEDVFNQIFLTHVESSLPQDRPLVLLDYPSQIQCLAKEKEGTPYRERWELYIAGIEIANCYSEMQDYQQVISFLQTEYSKLISQRSFTQRVIPDVDPSFAELFSEELPACSGTALGLDRLLMVLYNIKTIQGVMLFPFSDTMAPAE